MVAAHPRGAPHPDRVASLGLRVVEGPVELHAFAYVVGKDYLASPRQARGAENLPRHIERNSARRVAVKKGADLLNGMKNLLGRGGGRCEGK